MKRDGLISSPHFTVKLAPRNFVLESAALDDIGD